MKIARVNRLSGWRAWFWAALLAAAVIAGASAGPANISLHTSVTLPVDI